MDDTSSVLSDPYLILELQPGCSITEIKESYRKLIQQWHPDKCQAAGASDRFQEVKKAYDLLIDDGWREEHDRLILARTNTMAEVVSLDEFNFDLEDGDAYYYRSCRCGGQHTIFAQDLDDGYNTVQCSNCSINLVIGQSIGDNK